MRKLIGSSRRSARIKQVLGDLGFLGPRFPVCGTGWRIVKLAPEEARKVIHPTTITLASHIFGDPGTYHLCTEYLSPKYLTILSIHISLQSSRDSEM